MRYGFTVWVGEIMAAAIRARLEVVAWTVLTGAIGYFVLRDVPQYADFSSAAYNDFPRTRFYLVPHLVGAGLGILAGLLQFSARIRRQWPVVHRVSGRIYVIGCLVGAPAAAMLALNSDCVTCRPALGSLAVYWFATTLVAFIFIRQRSFAAHRAFMIRSFVAMNVFVIVRIGYLLAGAAGREPSVRTMVEFTCVFAPLLLCEAWLSWSSDVRAGAAAARKIGARKAG
ncbi:DUF2306 domain-containing protein [Sandarakinorhabdus oryzae]|uniref:DUF2306 domain-containing protein n=1 Tax=Sandarakinorhabdus oryzae TaxID=2675220 RepID=UPI0012E298B9|nr:DUF2306 domain-containing protein [Sandarakinorhabdus oryzae]